MKKSKTLIYLFIFASFVFILSSCKKKETKVKREVAIPVVLSKVEEGTISRQLSYTGTVRSKRIVNIFSKIRGRIRVVNFDEGDHVKQGDVLIEVEDDDIRANLDMAYAGLKVAQARLSQAHSGYNLTSSATSTQVSVAHTGIAQAREMVNKAKASYENAKIEYRRSLNLYHKGAISKQQLDRVTTQFKVAKSSYDATLAQLKRAEENLKLARANTLQTQVRAGDIKVGYASIEQAKANIEALKIMLRDAKIRSPISGVVTWRNREPGEMISPQDKKPAMVITDNSTVNILIDVPEGEIGYIKVGDKAIVTMDALPNRKFEGKIKTIIPSADPSSRSFTVKVSVPNPDDVIKNGMSAVVTIPLSSLKGIVVPRTWLKVIEGEFYVVKVKEKDGKLRAYHHKVDVGYYNETQAYIKRGLKVGDEVVSTGQENLKDGDLIKVVPSPNQTPENKGDK